MSLVAAGVNLTHRCTIERNDAEPDSWNNSGPADWEEHISDLRCRYWTPTGRETVANDTTVAAVTDSRLIVQLGTDVTPADRVIDVTSRGDVVDARPFTIRAVLPRKDHLELVLAKVA